jgi:hypothetical protein
VVDHWPWHQMLDGSFAISRRYMPLKGTWPESPRQQGEDVAATFGETHRPLNERMWQMAALGNQVMVLLEISNH